MVMQMRSLKLMASLVATILAVTLMVSAAHAAAYLKIADIKGESTDRDHADWILLDSVSWGSTQGSRRAAGSGSGPRLGTVGDMVVVKQVDASSPKILEAITNGETFPSIELDLANPDGSQPAKEPYMQYTLSDVIITSYTLSAGAQGERPTESISFNYAKVDVRYEPQDSKSQEADPMIDSGRGTGLRRRP